MPRIYLDHVSTTPLAREVRDAMFPYLGEEFGNPSSPNQRGRRAREAIDAARVRVAALLGTPPEEILFTGSATEANNLALKGVAAAGQRRRHIVAASTEHISILHPLRSLEKQGFTVTLSPVDGAGTIRLDQLEASIGPETLLVSVAHASAEIGTLQPLGAICRMAHARGVLVHTDATVTAGLLPLPTGDELPDLVTVAPHLFYGPQGAGALRVGPGIRLAPIIEGGAQETGLRAGTEPVAALVGFGIAAELALVERNHRAVRYEQLASRTDRLLAARIDEVIRTGHPERRVPGLWSGCVRGVEAEALLQALESQGVDAASGSACTTAVHKPSHVLEAIGIDAVLARGALSLSFGETNSDADPDAIADLLPRLVTRLRELSPLESA